jgi:uncharacterized protein (DUF885 family)
MIRQALIVVTAIVVLSGCGEGTQDASVPSTQPSAQSVDESSQGTAAFDRAVEELTLGYYRHDPESATYNGAPTDLAPAADARLNDRSVAGDKARVAAIDTLLTALEATAAEPLDAERRRVRATLITLFDGALAPSRVVDYGASFGVYSVWFLPYVINQNSGPTVDVPNLMAAQQSVRDAAEAKAYLDRLASLPDMLDGALAKMRHDVGLGAIPPDFIVGKARAVVDAFASAPATENALYASFVGKLEVANVAGADDFAAQALSLVDAGVLPAYRRVSAYLTEIEPRAPHDAGLWRLPNGAALYQAMIRHMTDSDLDAETVHQIGLDEVKRISGEMDSLLRAQGYVEGTVGERIVAVSGDPRFVYPNTAEGRAALLDGIQTDLAKVRAVLPEYFGVLPKHPLEVRAVPEFSQESAAGAYYDPPAPDGSRPGIYWVNLRDTEALPKFSLPTMTYHEAIPGHHMQMAIAVDQPTPFLARTFFSNASGEGWGLYAEALAAEMGLYADDPFGDLGRLRDELLRAVRLVVDTGIHAKKWSREQAIDYMVATGSTDRESAVSEIERYVVWPGQALGYKVGMLKLQQLRREAEAAYGDEFDIREFHDRILAVAALALPVIEQEMRTWIGKAGSQ